MVKKIRDINQFLTEEKALQLVEAAEVSHAAQLDVLLPMLINRKKDTQLVCVAGPSSSGKTIFTNRLKKLLEQQGISSLVLSMDNYFHDKENIKQDAFGKYDFEAVDVVDVGLFRQQLSALLDGEAVRLPRYNFHTGKKEYDVMPTKLSAQGLVFVEGIHALNYDDVFGKEWGKGHFGIYISPQDAYETDNGEKIEPHQVRMIRRMVRDACYRNCSMMGTLAMWDSVRNGEARWIVPYAKNADYKFNSSLAYELCVLKPFFLAQYEALSEQEKEKMAAYLDKKILGAFLTLSPQVVPQASVLNEFIPRIS